MVPRMTGGYPIHNREVASQGRGPLVQRMSGTIRISDLKNKNELENSESDAGGPERISTEQERIEVGCGGM